MRRRKPLPVEAPHINGIVVSPRELDLPHSDLDTERQGSYNNHHLYFTARKYGQFFITQTMRDLERNQLVLPKDVHAIYHSWYEPPKMPSIETTMDVIDEAYQRQELLRYGSANNPTFKALTRATMDALGVEYGRLK